MGPYKASLEWIGSVIPSQNTMERWAFLLMLVFVVVTNSTRLVQSKEVAESEIDSYYMTVSPSHQLNFHHSYLWNFIEKHRGTKFILDYLFKVGIVLKLPQEF